MSGAGHCHVLSAFLSTLLGLWGWLQEDTGFRVESSYPEQSQIINYLRRKKSFSVCLRAEAAAWCSVISTNMKVTDSLPSCKRHSCRLGCKDRADALKYQEFRQSLLTPKKNYRLFLLNCSIVYCKTSCLRLWFAHRSTHSALFLFFH